MNKHIILLVVLLPMFAISMQVPDAQNANVSNSVTIADVDSDQESVASTIPDDGDGFNDIADLEEAIEQCQGIKG